ncbi:MAG: pentapeptide repeat-containing protein [Henriciella sp.]
MIKLEVKNRWSGNVQFIAEIDCDDNRSYSFKLGLAVRWAFKNGAYLGGADLRGADLRGADLGGADLRGADLRGADLGGADLRGADLRGADLGNAYLRNAYLRGAYLGGAYLGGLNIIQGPIREDGYQYILYTSCLGGCVIKAGCREWVGENAIGQAREHCRTETSERYRDQALRIVDYLDGELKAIRALDAFKPALEVAA